MAVERCGYVPYLIDVDPATWSLEPDTLAAHPKLAAAGIVVPVAPYGRPPPQAAWGGFAALTGVPVVIDAAAAFEALAADPARFAGGVPIALSFQVTKAFSSAEGGAVVWSDYEGLRRVARSLNFGFIDKRESTGAGTNGKLSEYHAAVGLASLDAWPEKCAANARVAGAYRAAAASHGIADRLAVAPAVASNYVLFAAASEAEAIAATSALADARIESRLWYGRGIHREPYFASVARDATPCTDRIAPALVGLPAFEEIDDDEIERVVSAVAGVVRRAPRTPVAARLR
jgi:dTDP-4-amino-4,6-dideoxygalactose transaminase